jgi:hypothetical protein
MQDRLGNDIEIMQSYPYVFAVLSLLQNANALIHQ